MVFDRITLVNAYNVLKSVQSNSGLVKNILFNRKSGTTTKTKLRFKDLSLLKEFINNNYPYILNEIKYNTGNEGLWTLLAFEIHTQPVDLVQDLVVENNRRIIIQIEPVSRHVNFVNNIRGELQSQKKSFQNKLVTAKIDQIFKANTELNLLFKTLSSIENQLTPTEILENKSYITLIEKYYKPVKVF